MGIISKSLSIRVIMRRCKSSSPFIVVLLTLIHFIVAAPQDTKALDVLSSSAPKIDLPMEVDVGDPLKRDERDPTPGDNEYEYVDQDGTQGEQRQARGENTSQGEEADLNSLLNDGERLGREDIDALEDAADNALESRAAPCTEDGEKCQDNGNCCSGFCSWTRNFTCYTVAG